VIRAVIELEAAAITLCSDSQLVAFQIRVDYQSKEPLMKKYLGLVKESLIGVYKFKIKHFPRAVNSRADLLSKLASTKSSSALHSVVEEVIPTTCAILQIEDADWRTPLKNYIAKGILPRDLKEAKKIVQKSTRYVVIEGQLFKRGLSTPLLKCIRPSEIWYMLAELQVAQRYNLKVVKKNFQAGDLVMRKASIGNINAEDGKFKTN
jgi:hypothetical protein